MFKALLLMYTRPVLQGNSLTDDESWKKNDVSYLYIISDSEAYFRCAYLLLETLENT